MAVKPENMIIEQLEKHKKRAAKKGKTSKLMFNIGENCHLQDVKRKEWKLTGIILGKRTADRGQILSYNIVTDKGYEIKEIPQEAAQG